MLRGSPDAWDQICHTTLISCSLLSWKRMEGNNLLTCHLQYYEIAFWAWKIHIYPTMSKWIIWNVSTNWCVRRCLSICFQDLGKLKSLLCRHCFPLKTAEKNACDFYCGSRLDTSCPVFISCRWVWWQKRTGEGRRWLKSAEESL